MRQKLSSTNEVCHFFANKLQESGEAFAIFFRGGVLYSYGTHFRIAEHRDGYTLITERKYSNTTAKHISKARQAMSHLNVISVPNLDNLSKFYYDRDLELRNLLATYERSRINKGFYLNQISHLKENVEKYSAATRIEIPAETMDLIWRIRESVGNMAEECAKIQAELAAKELARVKVALKGWMNFEEGFTTGMIRGEFSWVRFNAEKDRFETSQAVNIDRKEGRSFYDRLRKGLIRKGDKIDTWMVISESEKVITIGCHKMKVSHLLEIGEKIFGV